MNTSSNKSTAREIDFLPESYREQSTQRKGQLWRFAVLALFTVVLPAASFCQYRMRTAINSDLTSLSPHYAAAQADTTRVAFLQGELKKAASAAELYTFLRHPWPRTQVLSALTETLPESITLRAISIDSLQAETSRESRRERHQTKDEEAKLALLPAADRDLAKLRKQAEKNYVVIQLDGETSTPVICTATSGNWEPIRCFDEQKSSRSKPPTTTRTPLPASEPRLSSGRDTDLQEALHNRRKAPKRLPTDPMSRTRPPPTKLCSPPKTNNALRRQP